MHSELVFPCEICRQYVLAQQCIWRRRSPEGFPLCSRRQDPLGKDGCGSFPADGALVPASSRSLAGSRPGNSRRQHRRISARFSRFYQTAILFSLRDICIKWGGFISRFQQKPGWWGSVERAAQYQPNRGSGSQRELKYESRVVKKLFVGAFLFGFFLGFFGSVTTWNWSEILGFLSGYMTHIKNIIAKRKYWFCKG